MENIKNIAKTGINIQRDKENKKYDLLIDEISKEDNIANIYYMIGEAYGNTLEQREVALSYLKEALVGEFFRNAEVKASLNGIEFFDDEYKVIFPTSRVRIIEIIDLKIERIKSYHSLVSSWEHKLGKLTEAYLANKTFSNLKTLKKHYIGMRDSKNPVRLMLEYKETIAECSLDKVEKIRIKEKLDVERLMNYEAEVVTYNNRQEESLDFAYSLIDLKSFTDVGWFVTLKDTDRYGATTKIKYK